MRRSLGLSLFFLVACKGGASDSDGDDEASSGSETADETGGTGEGNAVWGLGIGGPHEDRGVRVAVDSDGNVFYLGWFEDTIEVGEDSFTANGGYDILLVKLDADGEVTWARAMGGPSNDGVIDVDVDADGNPFIYGTYVETLNIDGTELSTNGSRGVFVAAFDVSGELRWANGYTSISDSDVLDVVGNSMAVDEAGDVYLNAVIEEGADFGGGVVPAGDAIVKLDVDGQWVWDQPLENVTYASMELETVGTDLLYVAGSFDQQIDLGGDVLQADYKGFFLAQFDASFAHQWSKGFQMSATYATPRIAANADGVVMAGNFGEPNANLGGEEHPNQGGDDIFVAGFDAAGEYLWSAAAGDEEDWQGAAGVALDADGGVQVTGYLAGMADLGPEDLGEPINVGGRDLFVWSLDADGTPTYSERFGDTVEGFPIGDAFGLDIAAHPSGDVVVVGYYEAALDFGNVLLDGNDSDDGFIVRLTPEY